MSIAHIPQELQAVGLMTSHVRPLVSMGKQNDEFSAQRVHPSLAWEYPEIELRTPIAAPALILDIDHKHAAGEVDHLVHDCGFPPPSWLTMRESNGHAHSVWLLDAPVYTSKKAHRAPRAFFQHIKDYFTAEFSADPAYRGVLTHNPVSSNYITRFMSAQPYSLSDLAEVIPEDWKPAKLKTGVGEGRNADVFMSLCQWAGKPENEDASLDELIAEACRMAAQAEREQPKDHPLTANEVLQLAYSVDGYRQNWTYYTAEERTAFARRNQAKGVANRRAKNEERNAHIRELRKQGWTQTMIALEVGLSQQAIGKILRAAKDTLSSANSPSIGRVSCVVK